ncbi:MAG: hypothetical protein ACTSQE_13640 [Candidatus Heimdallarchaeaceae archaeon]
MVSFNQFLIDYAEYIIFIASGIVTFILWIVRRYVGETARRRYYRRELKKVVKDKLNYEKIKLIKRRNFKVKFNENGRWRDGGEINISQLVKLVYCRKYFLIEGEMGLGKTILSYLLAQKLLQKYFSFWRFFKLKYYFTNKIVRLYHLPIIVELSELKEETIPIKEMIEKGLEKQVSEKIIETIKNSEPIFIFDAYDEYDRSLSINNSPRKLFQEGKEHSVIITSRPIRDSLSPLKEEIKFHHQSEEKRTILNSKKQYLELEPFCEKEIKEYLENNLNIPELKTRKSKKFLYKLNPFKTHKKPELDEYQKRICPYIQKEYLSIPLYLVSIVFDYRMKNEPSELSTEREILRRYFEILFCQYYGKRDGIYKDTIQTGNVLAFLPSTDEEERIGCFVIDKQNRVSYPIKKYYIFLNHFLVQLACNILKGNQIGDYNSLADSIFSYEPVMNLLNIDQDTISNFKQLLRYTLEEYQSFICYKRVESFITFRTEKIYQLFIVDYLIDVDTNNQFYKFDERIENEDENELLINKRDIVRILNECPLDEKTNLLWSFLSKSNKNTQKGFTTTFGNEITEVILRNLPLEPDLTFLANLSELQRLEIGWNIHLTTLPELKLPELKELIIENNERLTELPELELPEIKILAIWGNSSLTALAELKLPKLEYLRIDQNPSLTALPELELPKLKELLIGWNSGLTTLPELELPEIKILAIRGNSSLTALPELRLPKLEYLRIDQNPSLIVLPELRLPKLEYLRIEQNPSLIVLPEFELPELKKLLILWNSGLTTLPELELPKLKELLILWNSGLTALPELKLPKLKELAIRGNSSLTALPELKLPELKILVILWNFGLTALPELELPELDYLWIEESNIKEFDISSLVEVETFNEFRFDDELILKCDANLIQNVTAPALRRIMDRIVLVDQKEN